jgi:2-polyprenyl-3-methyl-5-hydroxy-6-metoxy-1,4-benzoquinol methylase
MKNGRMKNVGEHLKAQKGFGDWEDWCAHQPCNALFSKAWGYISQLKTGKLLDIGCEYGSFSAPLTKTGWECHGVDIFDKPLQTARNRGVKTKKFDVTKGLPYQDSMFDVVYAGMIIEHLIDTDYFLKECYRVMKRGGVLILTTPNLAYLRHRLQLLFGFVPLPVTFSCHFSHFTSSSLRSRLNSAGFRDIEIRGSYFICSRVRMRNLGTIFEKIAELHPSLLSADLIAIAKK